MVMLECNDGGNNDFYINDCGKTINTEELLKQDINWCVHTFADIQYNSELIRPYSAPIEYGLTFAAQSNIVFT